MKQPGDPIKEADVYLAYGQNEQATRVLEFAIEKDPERDDFRVKLGGIKKIPHTARRLNVQQRLIITALLILAATLSFLNYQPWFGIADVFIGVCALIYGLICLFKGRRV